MRRNRDSLRRRTSHGSRVASGVLWLFILMRGRLARFGGRVRFRAFSALSLRFAFCFLAFRFLALCRCGFWLRCLGRRFTRRLLGLGCLGRSGLSRTALIAAPRSWNTVQLTLSAAERGERRTGLHCFDGYFKRSTTLGNQECIWTRIRMVSWRNGCVCATHHIPAVIRTVARVGRLVGRQ